MVGVPRLHNRFLSYLFRPQFTAFAVGPAAYVFFLSPVPRFVVKLFMCGLKEAIRDWKHIWSIYAAQSKTQAH